MDEGVLHSEAKYTLTQFRLGNKLPSLHNPLPHGRGDSVITCTFPAEGQGPELSCTIVWTPPFGGAQISFLHARNCASLGAMNNTVSRLARPVKMLIFRGSPFLFFNTVKFVKFTGRFH